MIAYKFGRRDFLRLSLLAGLSGLASCTSAKGNPVLRSTLETVPKKWRRALPAPWRFRELDARLGEKAFNKAFDEGADLLALGDGWLYDLPIQQMRSINAPILEQRLETQARNFLEALGDKLASKVLPVGVSPWVLLFRNGGAWLSEANEGWNVLLNDELAGQVVMPQSPYLVMSLAEKMGGGDALRRLRSQVKIFDDRNGLNWLLKGDALVAVLPLQRCLPLLRRDPRLSVVLPQSGSPLHWTVLVQSKKTREPFPQAWVEKAWDSSSNLLGKLLANGWIPPISRAELRSSLVGIPEEYQPIILPSDEVWQRCWSIPPLGPIAKKKLLELWERSSP